MDRRGKIYKILLNMWNIKDLNLNYFVANKTVLPIKLIPR